MTSLSLKDFDTAFSSYDTTQTGYQKALNMSDLETNKPYLMTEWREVTYTVNNEDRTQAIGTLDDGSEFWIPKSMLRKIERQDGPYMFVYRGRKSDKWRTYIVDVMCGNTLREKGLIE